MENTLDDIIEKSICELERIGLTPKTIKSMYVNCFNYIKKTYSDYETTKFDPDFIQKIETMIQSDYDLGLISRKIYNARIRCLDILRKVNSTGVYEWEIIVSQLPRSETKFDASIIDYLAKRKLTKRPFELERKILFEFADFLIENNIEFPNEISPKYVLMFIKFKSIRCSTYLDKICAAISKYVFYLYETKMLKYDFHDIVKASCRKDKKVKNVFDIDDLYKVLNSIDRTTPIGKRDYAVVALAFGTGLRAGDMINIKLSDIDWKNKILSIVQEKTKVQLDLPLNKEILDIIADYILNARPETTSDILFIRFLPPYVGFSEGTSLNNIIRRMLSKTGIVKKNNDGKTIHGIRRLIGTELIKKKFPIDTVAQVLGHQSIIPTRQYISLDLEGLKKCTLPLSSLGETK